MASKNRMRQGQSRVLNEQRQKATQACAALFFLALTVVFPLYLNGEKYVRLTMHKAYFFWLITFVSAIAMLAILLWFRLKASANELPTGSFPKITVAEWTLIAFLLLVLISAIVTEHQDIAWSGIPEPEGRYEGFITFLCYGLAFWLIARFYAPRNWHLYAFAGSSILVSLIGVMQFMDMDIFDIFPYTRFMGSNGFPLYAGLTIFFRTTLGNVDIVSAYTALTVVFFAALYAGCKSRWRFIHLAATMFSFGLLLIAGADAGKVGILGAMVLLIPYWLADKQRLARILIALSSWSAAYAIYQSYWKARVAEHLLYPAANEADAALLTNLHDTGGIPALWPFWLISALLVAAAVALLYLLKTERWPRKMPVIGLVVLGVCIAGGLLGVEILGARWADQPGNIIYQAREMMHGRLDDNFGSTRGWVWKRSLAALPDHWLLGVGPDAFYFALPAEQQADSLARYSVTFDKAHNNLLQYAITLGIPALLCYLGLLAACFVPAVKKAFHNPLLLAAGAGCLAYLMQGFFGVDVPIASPLQWAMMGLMAGALRTAKPPAPALDAAG